MVRSKSALKLELQNRSKPSGQILARLSPVLVDFIKRGALVGPWPLVGVRQRGEHRKQPFRRDRRDRGGLDIVRLNQQSVNPEKRLLTNGKIVFITAPALCEIVGRQRRVTQQWPHGRLPP